MKSAKLLVMVLLAASACGQVSTSQPGGSKEVEAVYPEAYALYLDLHQNPELSSHEVQTAAKLASRLRALGYDVTEHVGGTGIVAILKNGAGPTVMLRTELDARCRWKRRPAWRTRARSTAKMPPDGTFR
jgi:hippurate hydrolase